MGNSQFSIFRSAFRDACATWWSKRSVLCDACVTSWIRHLQFLLLLPLLVAASCSEPQEHTAPAINERDSVPMMRTYGVNTLISDSGVMRYRMIAERWMVNEVVNPPRWIFPRGIFMEQFDEKFHPEAYIQADTAYYYTVQKLWHLIGNVRVKTVDGLRFNSEELYWDQERHELYSNLFSRVVTPERELQGNRFTSDERMQHYSVTTAKGSFQQEDADKKNAKGKDTTAVDTTPKRAPAQPRRTK